MSKKKQVTLQDLSLEKLLDEYEQYVAWRASGSGDGPIVTQIRQEVLRRMKS